MIKKIDHFVIITKDPNACLDFYQKLGFRADYDGDRYQIYAGDFKINVYIKGQQPVPHAEYMQVGSADFCLEISDDQDLATVKQNLEAKGLSIELGIVQRTGTRKNMHSIYLRDPDGNLVELCSYK